MKIPKHIKEWAEKEPEPAFALACWFVTTPEFKEIVKGKVEKWLRR